MTNIKRIKGGLALFVGVLALLLPLVGHAQSIDYSALKYGTNQTSMASGYFVHPATVTVKNQAYVVTMDLKTAKKLTSWPVRVLSVDGHAPENVRKVKDSAGNSHVYYSFTTTNLKRTINAKLAINVPDVYKAKHKISFRFKTGDLPALGKTATPTTTARRTTRAATEPATASSKASSSASQSSRVNKQARSKSSSAVASTSSQSAPASQSTAKADSAAQSASDSDQVPQQKTHWGALTGGVVAILILVGGGSWWYFGRH